jgi:hypothetical protein
MPYRRESKINSAFWLSFTQHIAWKWQLVPTVDRARKVLGTIRTDFVTRRNICWETPVGALRKECKPCRSKSIKQKTTHLSSAEESRGGKDMGHLHGALPLPKWLAARSTLTSTEQRLSESVSTRRHDYINSFSHINGVHCCYCYFVIGC